MFPSQGVSGPSLLQRPLSPLGAPARPHSASPPGPEEPRPHCQPPSHTGLPSEGHWPPSPESPLQAGFGSFPVAGQHPAARVACPEEPPAFPQGLEERDGPAVRRQDTCWVSGSRWEPWACVSVQPGLPASPVPPHFSWDLGWLQGERVCRQDGSGLGAVPPPQGQGGLALWPGLCSLQTAGPRALLSLSSPVREAVGGDGQAWSLLLGARPSHWLGPVGARLPGQPPVPQRPPHCPEAWRSDPGPPHLLFPRDSCALCPGSPVKPSLWRYLVCSALLLAALTQQAILRPS